MQNPYEGLNWQSAIRIASATHLHIRDQHYLDNGRRYGLKHFPISNYYPSAPYNADTKLSDFRLRQSWGTKRYGKPFGPPINWNDIIFWVDEINEPCRADFPFTESEPVFTDIPEDIIFSHNAEHHDFTDSRAHVCSPGSSFASGNFDVHGHYHLNEHGFPTGFGGPWREAFEGMLKDLDYPDGGGITINHPTWFSRFSDEQVLEMLDFDERVLGIEIFNDYSAGRNWLEDPYYKAPHESEPGFSLSMWDRILSTGRKCWGFCVPDHSVCTGANWHGRNILLVSEFTEHNCLKAYRLGQFYGYLKDNGLTIRDFAATKSAVSVDVSAPARVNFITEAGQVATVEGEQAKYDIPHRDGRPNLAYVRIEIEDDSGERLFLQPVIYK